MTRTTHLPQSDNDNGNRHDTTPSDAPTGRTSGAPGAPDDGTTLTEVLAGYADGGFSGSFSVGDDTTVECHECGTRTRASRIRMSSLSRLEGASDPDDMFAVVALTCPSCGTQGTLILGFGPTAPAEDGDVLHQLQDFRHDDSVSGNSAPGETVGDDS